MYTFLQKKVGDAVKLTKNDTYKIALEITGCKGMEYPFYTSEIVECNNLELLHAILTCGMFCDLYVQQMIPPVCLQISKTF